MLRVGIFSKANSFGGGASRVAQSLLDVEPSSGVHTQHYIVFGDPLRERQQAIFTGISRKFAHLMLKITRKMGLQDFVPFEIISLFRIIRRDKLDVLHFHDISSAFSFLTPALISFFRPVYWTVHDCSPFTGGCIYPMGCEKFRTNCRSCPGKGEWPVNTVIPTTALVLKLKAWLMPRSRIKFLAPSRWMVESFKHSLLAHCRIEELSNGVSAAEFYPSETESCRRVLGIPRDKFVILISAGGLDDPRKGVRDSLELLSRMPRDRIFVMGMGGASRPVTDYLTSRGIPSRMFGYVSSSDLQRMIYNASDILLFCSRADNQPLTILESLLCGTPVASLAIGGIPQILTDRLFGVASDSLSALERELFELLENPPSIETRRILGNKAVERLGSDMFIQSHRKLYLTHSVGQDS